MYFGVIGSKVTEIILWQKLFFFYNIVHTIRHMNLNLGLMAENEKTNICVHFEVTGSNDEGHGGHIATKRKDCTFYETYELETWCDNYEYTIIRYISEVILKVMVIWYFMHFLMFMQLLIAHWQRHIFRPCVVKYPSSYVLNCFFHIIKFREKWDITLLYQGRQTSKRWC